jgi:hypothetical protein
MPGGWSDRCSISTARRRGITLLVTSCSFQRYYWMTRDAEYLGEKRSVWQPVIDFIRSSRQENGLLPKDNYAGDIPQQVISLSSNSTCWRGLRDMAEVIAELGDKAAATELRTEAAAFRQPILDAVAKSERKETQPRFIPIALLADEPAHDPLTATRMGSYYDLMAPYVLGSGVFAPGSDRETWLIEYLRQHGGIALGMIRSMPHQGEFNQQPGVNVLYGLRYMQTILRRGDRDHALVGFYGHLAQAMTAAPSSAAKARVLPRRRARAVILPATEPALLRHVHNAAACSFRTGSRRWPPGNMPARRNSTRWLRTAELSEKAPTAFGEVSFRVESRLRGQVRTLFRRCRVACEVDATAAIRRTMRFGRSSWATGNCLAMRRAGRVARERRTAEVHSPRAAASRGKAQPAAKAAAAPPGSQFARIGALSPLDREAAILREIVRGNVPEFLRTLKPISIEAPDAAGLKHKAMYFVTPDYLAIGSDDDFFRMPMRPKTAQAIAAACETSLITAKISDDIFRQAEVKLEPRPLTGP